MNALAVCAVVKGVSPLHWDREGSDTCLSVCSVLDPMDSSVLAEMFKPSCVCPEETGGRRAVPVDEARWVDNGFQLLFHAQPQMRTVQCQS